MDTICLSSDKTAWALPAFAHQWKKYLPDWDVLIAGYTKPKFDLFTTFIFESIGNFADFPVDRWSDGVIQHLTRKTDDLAMIVMDDYWLTRPVDRTAIGWAMRYMLDHPDAIRFDLTTDRLYDKHHDIGSIQHYDLIQAEKEATYNFSLQASIWRRELLLEMLRPGETPWEAEIRGSERISASPYRVVGTRQWPVKYIIAVNKGKLAIDGGWCVPPRQLSKADLDDLIQGNYIPEDKFND